MPSPSPLRLDAVAKRAKVSTATVSRVLNQVGRVRESTRQRVLKAIRELDYQPNLHASSLARGRTRTLGMVVSNLENPFFLDIFRAAEAEAHRRGYELVVANTGYDAEQLTRSVRLMGARRVAGLAIIVSEADSSVTAEIARHAIPVMLYDAESREPRVSTICVDYASGIRSAVRYLVEQGHRRLAFVGHHATLTPLSIREKAFRDTVAEFAPRVKWTSHVDSDGLEGGRRAALAILDSRFQPTALVCVNDLMAVGAIRALRERGLRVPQDLSVTGFDNIRLAEFCYPPLTTFHVAREQIGQIAADYLISAGEENDVPRREHWITPELIVRESTGRAAGT